MMEHVRHNDVQAPMQAATAWKANIAEHDALLIWEYYCHRTV